MQIRTLGGRQRFNLLAILAVKQNIIAIYQIATTDETDEAKGG